MIRERLNKNNTETKTVTQNKLIRIEEMENGVMKIFPSYKLNKRSVVVCGEAVRLYNIRDIEEDERNMRRILKEEILNNLIGILYEDIYKAYFVSINNYVAEFDIVETHRRYFLATLQRTFRAKSIPHLKLAIKL